MDQEWNAFLLYHFRFLGSQSIYSYSVPVNPGTSGCVLSRRITLYSILQVLSFKLCLPNASLWFDD